MLSRLMPADVSTFRGPWWTAGALAVWIVLWRYRGPVPLMLSVVTAEQLLRVAIGTAKPLTTASTPPGALSKVLLPAVAATLAISLTERRSGL